MIRFFKFLNTLIPNDKLLHFFWSFTTLIFFDIFMSDFWSAISLVILALLKELVWDLYMKKGNPSVLDFIFGTAPILFYLILKII